MIGNNPELYAAGSRRLIVEARESSRAQAYRRGQNSTQRRAIHPVHNPSSNMKLRGYTNALQNFAVMQLWQLPGAQRSTSQLRNSLPSINGPSPVSPVPTGMPWNQ